MEITFAVLLWAVRIAFLVLLYLFLVRAFGVLHRSLVAERAADGAMRALGVLVVERSAGRAPRVGERFPLRASTSIGRDAGNDVPLSDEAASARHAVLELRDGEWWIEDLGSTNGTLVNGTRIERAERVRSGDELAIGRIALRLEGSPK
ncbi:MAG TPA: FHA domain-containing protein [Candidatus Limnocylindria bacterium]|nr:FHA domain-containing protein [Candidatus Limnocylindria bacterium]